MEFKSCPPSKLSAPKTILIESQWNLNNRTVKKSSWTVLILIESQWNLNEIIKFHDGGFDVHINRITVEFK